VEVKKVFPVYSPSVVLPYSKPISEAFCQQMVHRILPCGHATFRNTQNKLEDFKYKTQIKVTKVWAHV